MKLGQLDWKVTRETPQLVKEFNEISNKFKIKFSKIIQCSTKLQQNFEQNKLQTQTFCDKI